MLDQSKKSIELNAQYDSGATALMFACQKGHKDVAKLLTNYSNNDLNIPDEEGHTAFMD